MRTTYRHARMLDHDPLDAIFLMVTGSIKKNGAAVLGRGLIKHYAKPDGMLAYKLAQALRQHGRTIGLFSRIHRTVGRMRARHSQSTPLVMFPTRPEDKIVEHQNEVVAFYRDRFKVGSVAPSWALRATPDQVMQSLDDSLALIRECGWESVAMALLGNYEHGEIPTHEMTDLFYGHPISRLDNIHLIKSYEPYTKGKPQLAHIDNEGEQTIIGFHNPNARTQESPFTGGWRQHRIQAVEEPHTDAETENLPF